MSDKADKAAIPDAGDLLRQCPRSLQNLTQMTIADLTSLAASRCLAIFDEFTVEQIYEHGRPANLVSAWEIGAAIRIVSDRRKPGRRQILPDTTTRGTVP